MRSSQTTNPQDNTRYLTVSDIKDTVHTIVSQRLTTHEPMPAWGAVDLAKLDSALASPRQSAFGKPAYPTLHDKTAILLYTMVKSHAWENGNKRMAMVSGFLFAALNDMWWNAAPEDIFAHMTWVAASEAACYSRVLDYLKCYFERKLAPITSSAPLAQPS